MQSSYEKLKRLNFFITGSNGQLGQSIQKELSFHDINFTAMTRSICDITNADQLWKYIDQIKPDVLINCAACVTVDDAEEQPEKCIEINFEAVESMSRICQKKEIKLVHFSTDYVFDGKKGEPYTEEDEPSPLNVYGQSKLDSEKAVQALTEDYLILRLSWVFGGQQSFLHRVLEMVHNDVPLKMTTDEVSVPTSSDDIAKMTCQALDLGLEGLYHATSDGFASRYEFADYFLKQCNIDRPIEPILSKDFICKAERPLYSVMSNKKLTKDLGNSLPHWQNAVKRFIQKEIQN